jgi:hypothetical protein
MSFFRVVVARYKEDVNWLRPLSDSLLVFNKGDDVPPFPYTQLPNVGRESHTYLNYIIENYRNLPEVVVFTQGNISDHLDKDDHLKLVRYAEEARKHGMSQNYGLWPTPYEWRISAHKGQLSRSADTLGQWFEKNVHPVHPGNTSYVYVGGIFAVRRDRILSHPVSYYQNLLRYFQVLNPEEGHFMERSWYYVFVDRTVARTKAPGSVARVGAAKAASASTAAWMYAVLALAGVLVVSGGAMAVVFATKKDRREQ